MKIGNALPPGIRIRKFRVEDLEVIKQLIDTTITISYRGVYPEEAIDYFLVYHSENNILEDANHGCMLVLIMDRIVGYRDITRVRDQTSVRRSILSPEGIGDTPDESLGTRSA